MNEHIRQYARAAGLALAAAFGLALAVPALAQSQDGSLAGKTAPGAEVTVRDPDTGFSRTVKAGADGSFRFPFLPVGEYLLEARRDGETIAQPVPVTVFLGKTTHVNAGSQDLDVIQVVGSRTTSAIDVTSTESGTNITKLELERLPVDRDLLSVATLASGVNRGEFGGASFGGSSVAENAVYINGLNVTDFYRRIGFSSVPYAFYEEFQVKTGGYSVEFGRTTGGVINAVTRSGTNEFEFGAEAVWEPSFLQGDGDNHFDASGNPSYIASYDEFDRQSLNLYAGGPIVRDKLFFFAMYELRDYQPQNTSSAGDEINLDKSDDAFWGAKIDWQVNDNNLLEFLAFSDEETSATDVYAFDWQTGERGPYQGTEFFDGGGMNWSATYTSYLTDSFSVRAMYGENERNAATYGPNDADCHRIIDFRGPTSVNLGCTTNTSVVAREDVREQARLDFEWSVGDHLVRFGVDREVNTSDHSQHYPGPEALTYEIRPVNPGSTLENGAVVPDGVTAYVRTRINQVIGTFETDTLAFYLEDSWQITDSLVIDAGLRWDQFDNKDSEGRSYIKMDDMVAPRFGFAWDMRGDARSKLFGNAGRYFLPVANVINIKQAGGFADIRTFYEFEGLEDFEFNGQTYQRPILGPQIGRVYDDQGDGTVGDLRGEVDADMDPVYQDEIILGYQSMIDDKWSWGVRGIYRELHNAIDDMEITSTGIMCGGEPSYQGWVMANPGEALTVFADTDCDGEFDDWVTIDTSTEGWARYVDGVYVGDTGFPSPERTYKAIEFMLDRAWDDRWSMNASYTLSYNEGNTEGPVNSDTNFSDTGRTENFDTPWVNFNAVGYLPNDHRHQIKLRGAYGIGEHWRIGANLNARSGSPINQFGDGVPFDDKVYRSYYVCVQNCTGAPSERVFEHRGRGSAGRLPWIVDLGLSVTYETSFDDFDLAAKFAVYNVLNQQRVLGVEEDLEPNVGTWDPNWGIGQSYQSPRYAQFLVTVDF
jgi:hypothetical protein